MSNPRAYLIFLVFCVAIIFSFTQGCTPKSIKIPVYPGASPSPKGMLSTLTGVCDEYKTPDPADKVIEFYQKKLPTATMTDFGRTDKTLRPDRRLRNVKTFVVFVIPEPLKDRSAITPFHQVHILALQNSPGTFVCITKTIGVIDYNLETIPKKK